MPSQVTVYVVFRQSTAGAAGAAGCAVPVGVVEAHPAGPRQARARTARPQDNAAPEPLRDLDMGDHLDRPTDGGAPSRAQGPTGRTGRTWVARPAGCGGRAGEVAGPDAYGR